MFMLKHKRSGTVLEPAELGSTREAEVTCSTLSLMW